MLNDFGERESVDDRINRIFNAIKSSSNGRLSFDELACNLGTTNGELRYALKIIAWYFPDVLVYYNGYWSLPLTYNIPAKGHLRRKSKDLQTRVEALRINFEKYEQKFPEFSNADIRRRSDFYLTELAIIAKEMESSTF